MCMVADKVDETIRKNIEFESDKCKDGAVMPQIVFNLNFFMPGIGNMSSQGDRGNNNNLLAQSGATLCTQGGQSMEH